MPKESSLAEKPPTRQSTGAAAAIEAQQGEPKAPMTAVYAEEEQPRREPAPRVDRAEDVGP